MEQAPEHPTLQRVALMAGPAIFLLCALLPPLQGMSAAAQLTAGITLWMAIWWILEPVDTAVTSLLPLVLFPLSGVQPLKNISGEYGNEIIFLFMAGFFFGKTIEKWNLHRRIALRMVIWLGTNPSKTVLGFMVATAFISMWISNTATAVMMTPVAIAVAASRRTDDSEAGHRAHLNFCKALLLGVGYACSIGGVATPVGTPTNGIFLTFVAQKMQTSVSFGQWFLFGFPFATALLLICWQLLIRMFPLHEVGENEGRNTLKEELDALGPVTTPEKRLMLIFGGVILAWVTGSLLWYRWWPNCNDNVVAVAGAILLFLFPAGTDERRVRLLDWSVASRIPWGVLLFFGGGLALAKGFDLSGLDDWMGEQLKGLQQMPAAVILFCILAVVVALSEIASNIATASMMMPVLAVLAGSIGIHPFGLLLSATMAASFGFGLPVATAPNSIVYGSGYLTTRDMARAGFLLDLLAVVLLLAFIYGVLPWVWGISL
jgi:solute carrier family 13 (sodium-dependent dicarboxylate transporter), member 2/3/5